MMLLLIIVYFRPEVPNLFLYAHPKYEKRKTFILKGFFV